MSTQKKKKKKEEKGKIQTDRKVLFSTKKERNPFICKSTDEPGENMLIKIIQTLKDKFCMVSQTHELKINK